MKEKTTGMVDQIQREVVEAYLAMYSPQLVRRALTHLDRATNAERNKHRHRPWQAMLTRLGQEAPLSRSHQLAYEMFGAVALLTHERINGLKHTQDVLQSKRKDAVTKWTTKL